jgi:hypothetical protein
MAIARGNSQPDIKKQATIRAYNLLLQQYIDRKACGSVGRSKKYADLWQC